MIDSISSYLYSKAIDSKNIQQKSINTDNEQSNEDFSILLTKKLTDYSEMNDLSKVLSGSVLGSVSSSSKDLALLSEDLLNSGTGRKVVFQLAEGHLNSVAMNDNNDNEETESVAASLDAYTESVNDTSSLEEIVNQMASLIQDSKEK